LRDFWLFKTGFEEPLLNFKRYKMKKQLLAIAFLATLAFAGDYTNSIGMKFKDIPSGSFVMGTQKPNCNENDPFTDPKQIEKCLSTVYKSETPAHRVSVEGFYMGETEVTQGQWYAVMGNNPSKFKTGNRDMPVEQVSYYDAKEFIDRLNSKEGTNKYRLPTEEEWEYAARAGTTTKWYCGDSASCVSSIAVYNTNSPSPAKSKKPNKFGLYDMSGNVQEWVDSCYTKDYNSGCDGNYKVNRGGSWSDIAGYTRSAIRDYYSPDDRDNGLGFRLLRTK